MSDEANMESKEIRDVEEQLVFNISGGKRIVASMEQEINPDEELTFRAMSIYLEVNGCLRPLVAVEYTPRLFNNKCLNTLSTHVYTSESDMPIQTFNPMQRRSVWVTKDEGTYDINIWDEELNERDESLEAGHIVSVVDVHIIMEQIIAENPQFLWTKRPMQNKDTGSSCTQGHE